MSAPGQITTLAEQVQELQGQVSSSSREVEELREKSWWEGRERDAAERREKGASTALSAAEIKLGKCIARERELADSAKESREELEDVLRDLNKLGETRDLLRRKMENTLEQRERDAKRALGEELEIWTT